MTRAATLAALLVAAAAGPAPAAAGPGEKIPVTTRSGEARALYLQGRDAAEKLRVADGRALLARAVEKDPDFALAHWSLAGNAGSAKEFFASLERAVTLAPGASEAERHLILGLDAGVRGRLEEQREHYAAAVAAYPDDERARALLGNWYFGRQEYRAAVEQYARALEIAPSFSQPWNQLGYAHRFLGEYPEAERAFQRYVALIPGEPNPLDSQAELLLKLGRFEESMASYRKALALDRHFVASWVGIAVNQVLLGRPAEGRRTLKELREKVARDDGERRLALFWTAAAFVHEGKTGPALGALREMEALAVRGGDGVAASGDQTQMALVLLHAGKPAEAAAALRRAARHLEGARAPAEVKEAGRRNMRFLEARVALARGDLAGARTLAAGYRTAVEAAQVPFELRQASELDAPVALQAGEHARAAAALAQASQQDPEVLWLQARAWEGAGDRGKAAAFARAAAEHNELAFNHAFVRAPARKLAARLGG
jgi:tetratricopeptide (TPR) repeat protein